MLILYSIHNIYIFMIFRGHFPAEISPEKKKQKQSSPYLLQEFGSIF